jgi:hypothetical protein
MQTRPSGVAASDYQCADFDQGLPPGNVWAPTANAAGSLSITNTRASSLPNSLQTSAFAIDFSDDLVGMHFLGWSATGATPFTRASVAAAVNPTTAPGMTDPWSGSMCLLTVAFPSAQHASYACFAYTVNANVPWSTSYTGPLIYWVYFDDDQGDRDECQVTGSLPVNLWTNVEFRVSATTGLAEVTIGGTTSTCSRSPMIIPPAETAPVIQVGSRSSPTVTALWTSYIDNVRASVWR